MESKNEARRLIEKIGRRRTRRKRKRMQKERTESKAASKQAAMGRMTTCCVDLESKCVTTAMLIRRYEK